jgi:Mn-dependent DtxR family transcriptional regulator
MTDFTDEDLLEEISVFFPELRKPGDLDVKQLQKRFGVSDNTVHKIMEDMASTGEWEVLSVHNPSNGRRIKVIRKVCNGAS